MRISVAVTALVLIAPAGVEAQQTVKGDIGRRADSTVTALESKGFSGVVLVASEGAVVLSKGYGLANREQKIPFSSSSVVQIGSNTKDFTIVAVLQLMEQGKLSLSDPISRFFKNVPADKRGITVEQLLRHQAGFGQHMGPDFDPVTRDEEISRALAAKLEFAPGADRKYSNIGYSLLAAIIEMVSGKSYDEYVRDAILAPLDLHDTGLLLPGFDPRRVAHGYRDGVDRGTFLERSLAKDGPWWNLRGNGGMLSTVEDMYRFYRALLSDNAGGLLKPDTRNLFFRPDQPSVLAGSDMTFYFFYSHFPGAGLDMILVSNSSDYPAGKAREEVASALGIAPPRGQISTTMGPGKGAGAQISIDTSKAVSFPETAPGRAAQNFIRTNNGGDATAVRRFIENDVVAQPGDKRSIDERVTNFRGMAQQLGKLTLSGILSQTETEIVFAARSTTEGTTTFTITVEPRAPFRITGIRAEAR